MGWAGEALGIINQIYTALIPIIGSFPDTRVFGWLGIVVITTALLCDLFVLPALLTLFGKHIRIRTVVGLQQSAQHSLDETGRP